MFGKSDTPFSSLKLTFVVVGVPVAEDEGVVPVVEEDLEALDLEEPVVLEELVALEGEPVAEELVVVEEPGELVVAAVAAQIVVEELVAEEEPVVEEAGSLVAAQHLAVVVEAVGKAMVAVEENIVFFSCPNRS